MIKTTRFLSQPLIQSNSKMILGCFLKSIAFHRKALFVMYMGLLTSVASAQTTINMEKIGGVHMVPCKVNGISLRFILDTGASDVSISLTEAGFLFKNGLLKESDFIGTEYYQTANGEIIEGMKVILREIEFAGVVIKNVVASVTLTDEAPLLLGQSVLSRIGTYQIDPVKHTFTISRKTAPSTPGQVTDIDGNSYKVVQIGSQTWMAENLKTTKYSNGEAIENVVSDMDWANITIGGFSAYDNNPTLANSHGLLYNWAAVVDGRGICPQGWHVPSKEELETLIAEVQSAGIRTGSLKNQQGWNTPNVEAKNQFGFNVSGSGKRWFKDGAYQFFNEGAYYWLSSSSGAARSYYFAFSFDSPELRMATFFQNDGFSCRCIKD